jgi:hypothetical protein
MQELARMIEEAELLFYEFGPLTFGLKPVNE